MVQHVVLIDYENQQALDLEVLRKTDGIVRVFLGMNQRNAPVDLITALQPLGTRVEYVSSKEAAKNAVDFQLTFHLGRLSASYPGSCRRIATSNLS